MHTLQGQAGALHQDVYVRQCGWNPSGSHSERDLGSPKLAKCTVN